MFSFLYLFFIFYPTPIGDSQKGKRKTSEQAVLSDSNTRSERQKKMMYFGGHSLEEDLEWSEPQIKDSGVDTCSSTTLNEEHSHSDKVLRLWSLPFNLLIWSSFALCHSFKQNIIKGQGIARVNVAFLKVQKRKTKPKQTKQNTSCLLCCFCCLTAYQKISKWNKKLGTKECFVYGRMRELCNVIINHKYKEFFWLAYLIAYIYFPWDEN